MSVDGTHGDRKFSTSHTMSNVVTHSDRKFSTVYRMSNVGKHGDPKFSTSHTMSVDESHDAVSFLHHTEYLLTNHTMQ